MHDKTQKIVAIENAILKLLKVLSSINNAFSVVLSFISTTNPVDMEPSDILG